jgi:hypothetical protein
MSQTVELTAVPSFPPSAIRSLSIFAVVEAAMDRLKLETVYLRALDALMSADEYQIQDAIFRLRRAQARLHGSTRRASLPVHFSPHSMRPPKAA